MSLNPVTLPPGLGDLLRALRTAGLALGAREVLRLHRAFALEPELAQEREADAQLRRLLTAALVHGPEEGEVFDEVYETWSEHWRSWERTARREEEAEELIELRSRPRKTFPWRRVLVLVPRLVVLLLAFVLLPHRPPVVEPPAAPPERPRWTENFKIIQPGPIPETYEEWVPKIEVVGMDAATERRPALRPASSMLLLGGSVVLLAAALWERHRRRPPMPEPLPPPTSTGPERLPALPIAASGPELLDAEAARTLIWGVGRHFTEDFRPELDLDETVRRTAEQAGMPELRFERESRLREVWLWVDGTVEDPALEAYAEEIAASLAEAGLPARIGGFEGYPLELAWDEGHRFRPQELEAHRQTALVAVLTDGAVLLRHLADERQGAPMVLLRALARWPRLAFVDFSGCRPELRAALEKHRLDLVGPESLPAFFGLGSAVAPLVRPSETVELELWRAAMALAPRPVERREAFALRRELGLEVSPWALDKAADVVEGTRLGFEPRRRSELLVWLTDLEEAEALRPGGVLDRGLAFWEWRLDEEEAGRREPGRREYWQGSPAERRLAIERALLRLWRDPAAAAEELAALRGPGTEERLCAELAGMAARDGWREGLVRLPWLFGRQSDRTRYLLAELGLGGVGEGSLRRSGRFGAALGALLGLGVAVVAAGLFGVKEVAVSGADEPRFRSIETLPAGVFPIHEIVATGSGWRAVAGTPRHLESVEVEPGALLDLGWERRAVPCIERFGDVELWRCGPEALRATTRDAVDWPRRNLAVMLFPADDIEVRELATVLLYSGSADAVLLGSGAMDHFDRLVVEPALAQRDDQLLILRELGKDQDLEPPFSGRWAVATAIGTGTDIDRLVTIDGTRTLEEVWGATASPMSGDVQGVRLSYCPRQEAELAGTGMRWVRVCPGRFTMGDDVSEWDDEKPAHQVTITQGFWMARHEVTRAEYERRKPRNGEDSMPVALVTWDEARSFCQSLEGSDGWEYELPTEAQWEYAARAGTTTRWSFGDDEAELGKFAWFGGNSGGEAHVVATREPNPWGLFDMHGNVWEWCRDPPRTYTLAAIADPLGQEEGTASGLRALRGGAYWLEPRSLRSAYRYRFRPTFRYEFVGFRCVRVPRRPP